MSCFFFFVLTDEQVLSDVRKVTHDPTYTPQDPRELANKLLVTCYMGTKNSSVETYNRAKSLADQIGRLVWTYLHKMLRRCFWLSTNEEAVFSSCPYVASLK